MIITISRWTSHYNQFIYSLFFYCESKRISFKISYSSKIPNEGILLNFNNNLCFLDYSDSTIFIDKPEKYDFYFKRSLDFNSQINNIKPLNFQVNFSFKPLKLITKIPLEILKAKSSKFELVRALDYYSLFTNDSHQSKKIKNLWTNEINDNKGRIIFMTRLWDPARNNDSGEKERRVLQNNFRINACRIISKNFPNSITGIYPDYYAKEIAKDVLLDLKKTKKQTYISELKKSDICIADDGLKDTPGWKIGEYAMLNKAIISTPIKTIVEQFKSGKNYIKLEDRTDFKNLPDIINELIKSKLYLEIKENNKIWSNKYLKPDSYIENILKNCK
tara:strand:+ start:1093 stop:2091 length:999 start_codon:yes stop_codon:yes gene_type:complete